MPPRLLLVLVVGFVVAPLPALAQRSRCADCHIANPQAPSQRHVSDWDLTAHGRKDVGCEKCHGGDATTFESSLAHRGILPSGNPASRTALANLPATCGVCHAGPYVAFQHSRHYEVLRAGDKRAPSCSTCHGDVGGFLLSPKGLEAQCRQCHGTGKAAPQPETGTQARLLLEGIRDVRASLDAAQSLIRRVKDPKRRAAFEEAYGQAQVPVTEAVDAGHSFVFTGVEERLGAAQRRAAALLERLANPAAVNEAPRQP